MATISARLYKVGMAQTQVAVVQLNSTPEVEANLAAAERQIRRAAAAGAALIVLPEAFAYLGPELGQRAIAEPLPAGGPILARCQGWARETKAELILGGFWEARQSDDRVYNASVHLGRDGAVKAVYRKIHLFDVELADGTTLRESDKVAPGEEIVTTETVFGTLGMSICYDVRFPELYRKLVDRGAIAITVPAAFTLHTGKDHWHVLLQARAIESQSYVLAAAQAGKCYGARVSYGHALIADPWGTVIAQCGGEGEGFALATLDTDSITRIRAQLPSLRHRRLT
ncbi:MAG TPA: carbon-nitrogen hydrolase family protein [Polyangiales bacterium]|nr:carbon-nitrogen hydrolase family protein [Polyangiales bacterium]